MSIDSPQRDDAFSLWADALLSDPLTSLSSILDGRGSRGAQHLAAPDDFLADLLARRPLKDRRTALTAVIDGALAEWLDDRAHWSPSRVRELGRRAYVGQFCDALAVAARLPLTKTPECLVENVGWLDDLFRDLRQPDDADPVRQFNLVLAHHQSDGRLKSRWFGACEEAARAHLHWRSDLGAGMIGLRKIPAKGEPKPEGLPVRGLVRFADASARLRTDSTELRAAFQRHALVLTELYPRHDSHWKRVWTHAFRGVQDAVREEWLAAALPSRKRRNTTGMDFGR